MEKDEIASSWCYRGEGNGSIVIANLKENIVYRIPKSNCKKLDKVKDKNCSRSLEDVLSFVNNVMNPLIGFKYVVPMKIVNLSSDFVHTISNSICDNRPDYRLNKELDISATFALEMPDLCNLSPDGVTFSVEIKPKWGFLPTVERVAEVKKRNCRFCMHQFEKISSKKWSKRSNYCPIDLFSGCPARMRRAITNLLDTPQNNLRIFKNGAIVWSNEHQGDLSSDLSTLSDCQSPTNNRSTQSLLTDLIVDCLRHSPTETAPSNSSKRQICHSSTTTHSCTSDCPGLPENCVLARILAVQLLDDLDIEGLAPYFDEINEHFLQWPASSSNITELSDSVHEIEIVKTTKKFALDFFNFESEKNNLDGPFIEEWINTPSGDCSGDSQLDMPSSECSSNRQLDEAIINVKKYLVSRSTKDCSILISIVPLKDRNEVTKNEQFVIELNEGSRLLCTVSIIDLDPKPFNKIPYYLKEDQDIVDTFNRSCQSSSCT